MNSRVARDDEHSQKQSRSQSLQKMEQENPSPGLNKSARSPTNSPWSTHNFRSIVVIAARPSARTGQKFGAQANLRPSPTRVNMPSRTTLPVVREL